MDAAPPPAGGAKSALTRLAEATLGALRTRAELAGVELVIERERLLRRAALLVGGAVMLAFGALFAGALVIAAFWDSHRLTAIAMVAVAHVLAGAWLVARSRKAGDEGPPPFAATLAELDKDREALSRLAGTQAERP
jgi:uncharacterized membrane protein YqjE